MYVAAGIRTWASRLERVKCMDILLSSGEKGFVLIFFA